MIIIESIENTLEWDAIKDGHPQGHLNIFFRRAISAKLVVFTRVDCLSKPTQKTLFDFIQTNHTINFVLTFDDKNNLIQELSDFSQV